MSVCSFSRKLLIPVLSWSLLLRRISMVIGGNRRGSAQGSTVVRRRQPPHLWRGTSNEKSYYGPLYPVPGGRVALVVQPVRQRSLSERLRLRARAEGMPGDSGCVGPRARRDCDV